MCMLLPFRLLYTCVCAFAKAYVAYVKAFCKIKPFIVYYDDDDIGVGSTERLGANDSRTHMPAHVPVVRY